MSLTLFHHASQHAAPSSFGKMRVIRARVARSAAPVLREIGTFILAMAVFATIMAALIALGLLIWLPRGL